jgi:endonuclease/exonuclease/phosphatase family metal-dependent hydrolase
MRGVDCRQHSCRWVPLSVVVLVGLHSWCSMVSAGEPIIDGVFDEWTDVARIAKDESGDATAAFDLSHLGVRTCGTRLYLHFDIGRELNLQAGPGDEGTLQLLVDLPAGRRLSIDFRNRFACWTDQPEQQIPWTQIKFACLPTFAAKEYELRLDLASLGARVGDAVKIQFAGSDSLTEPVPMVLANTPAPPTVNTTRQAASDVRIANLNTFYEGLSHAPRSQRISRLLASVDADIYCFQEELREELFRTGAQRVVPKKDGADLNLHWQGDCGIATCWPMQPLPMEFEIRFSRAQVDDRATGAAAAVELPDGQHLVVCAIHLSCCGSLGDARDQARVRETLQLARQLQRLRAGEFGEHLRSAAVVVVGDYNLVGSRKPLATLESAGLTEFVLRGLADRSACTWRGAADESYWPGRLDLLAYDAGRLEPRRGFILNTEDLSATVLSELGLRSDDSAASDHLLLVADFAVRVK